MLLICGIACGQGHEGGARGAEICAHLAGRLEERLDAHERDLPSLRSDLVADVRLRYRLLLDARWTDFFASQVTVAELGRACWRGPREREGCPWQPPSRLDDPDDVMTGARTLLEGFRGRGPCARTDGPAGRGLRCADVAAGLQLRPSELDLARQGWNTPIDADGTWTLHATWSADRMADWRALVDYGLAVAPSCMPKLAAGCEGLREGLAGAPPEALAARVHALQAAYREAEPCPAHTGMAGELLEPPGAARPARP